MKHSNWFAVVVGLVGLLMVMGARDTRAQEISPPQCFLVGQAQYRFTVLSLGPATSPRPFVLGGLRVVSISGAPVALPLSGGGADVSDGQNVIRNMALHEATSGGGTSNPAATTFVVIHSNRQVPDTYVRTEYGGAQPITTQGMLAPCASTSTSSIKDFAFPDLANESSR